MRKTMITDGTRTLTVKFGIDQHGWDNGCRFFIQDYGSVGDDVVYKCKFIHEKSVWYEYLAQKYIVKNRCTEFTLDGKAEFA